MNGLRAARERGLDYAVNPQVALDRRRGADQITLVREAHVHRRSVRFRVDRDRRDVPLAARAHDAHCNLAAVGDENFFEHKEAVSIQHSAVSFESTMAELFIVPLSFHGRTEAES